MLLFHSLACSNCVIIIVSFIRFCPGLSTKFKEIRGFFQGLSGHVVNRLRAKSTNPQFWGRAERCEASSQTFWRLKPYAIYPAETGTCAGVIYDKKLSCCWQIARRSCRPMLCCQEVPSGELLRFIGGMFLTHSHSPEGRSWQHIGLIFRLLRLSERIPTSYRVHISNGITRMAGLQFR